MNQGFKYRGDKHKSGCILKWSVVGIKGSVWLDMVVELRMQYCREIHCIIIQKEWKFNLTGRRAAPLSTRQKGTVVGISVNFLLTYLIFIS